MKLRKWSYSEERNRKFLLTWSNPPCWKIVDDEFIQFSQKFENNADIEDVLR